MQQTAEAPARTVFADDEHRPEDYQEAEEPILSQTQRDSDDEANAAKAAAAAALQADKRRTAQLVRRIFSRTYDQLRDDYNMEELAALATTAKRVNAECAGVVKEMHDELAAPIKEARKG